MWVADDRKEKYLEAGHKLASSPCEKKPIEVVDEAEPEITEKEPEVVPEEDPEKVPEKKPVKAPVKKVNKTSKQSQKGSKRKK